MKKAKHLRLALAALAVVGGISGIATLTSCGENSGTKDVSVDWATGYAKIILEQNKSTVTGDFTVPTVVELDDGKKLDVSWTSDNQVASIGTSKDGHAAVTVDYLHNQTADQKVKLVATLSYNGTKASTTKEFTFTVPKMKLTTIAELDAAAAKTTATLKGVITAREAYSASNKNTSVYIQCEGGGLEAYRLVCATEEKYNTELAIGNTIYVSGTKSYYNGLRELAAGCTYVYDSTVAKQTITAEDVTSKVTSGEGVSNAYQGHIVKLTDVEIISVTPGSSGESTIVVGDSTDTTKQIAVRISKYFAPEDSDLNKEFAALKLMPGKKITVTGLLGWYNVPQVTPTASGNIVVSETVNYQGGLANAYIAKAKSDITLNVIPGKKIALPSKIADAGLEGEGYSAYTVEWSSNSEAAVISVDKNVSTLTTVKPAADTKVTLTLKVKNSAGEVVETRTFEFTVLEKVTYTSFDDYIKAKDGVELNVKGVIVAFKSSKKEVWLQDANGKVFYAYFSTALANDKCVIGKEIGVSGKLTTYNNLDELGSATLLEVINDTPVTVTPTNYTENFSTNGFTALDVKDQYKFVEFAGTVKSINKANYTITVGDKDIIAYSYTTMPEMEVGDSVTIKGLLGCYYNKTADTTTYQVYVTDGKNVTVNLTDTQKVDRQIAKIKAAIGTATIELPKTVNCTPSFDGVTVAVALGDPATALSYNATSKVLTIDPQATQATETVTFTVTSGEVTKTEAVTITTKLNEKARVTDFSGNNTAYKLASGAVDVTKLGLSADEFEATAEKNANTGDNSIYVSKSDLRLYQDATNGNGTQITISVKSGEIASVQVVLDSSYKAVTVLKGTDVVTAKNGSYTINGTSFTLKNAAKDGQVRITSIIIILK